MKHRVKSLSLALGLAFISNQDMALAQMQNVEAVRDVLGRQSIADPARLARLRRFASGRAPCPGC